MPNDTQEQRVLKTLEDAGGAWVSGQHFLNAMRLSQYHARIWALQRKGVPIEASPFTDDYGFKSYRLMAVPLKVKDYECCYSHVKFGVHSQDCELYTPARA
jgi:biotin operon repressor